MLMGEVAVRVDVELEPAQELPPELLELYVVNRVEVGYRLGLVIWA